MNGRTLRTTAGLAGTVAAAAAGALAVGLISGVVHTLTRPQVVTTNTGTPAISTSPNSNTSTSGIDSVSQKTKPVAGSYGSDSD